MTRRGQLVLAASAVVVVALVALLAAYLQLGYAADVRTGADYDDPAADAQRALVRAVHGATADVPGNYTWEQRETAATAVRDDLRDRFETIEEARFEEGIARSIEENATRANVSAREDCPDGPGREFGPCETDGGLVLQERADRTHVVAVAVDLRVTEERGRTELTTVVRPVEGDG